MYLIIKLFLGLVLFAIGYGIYGIHVWSVERHQVPITCEQYLRAGEPPRWVVLTDCQIDYPEGFQSHTSRLKDQAWFVPIRATGESGPTRLVLEVTDPDRVAILENRVQLTAEQYNFRGPIAGLFEYTSDKTLKGIRKKGGRSIREPISVLTENEKPHFALPAFSLVAGLFVLGGFVWVRYGPAPARPAPADPQRHSSARSPREMIDQTRQIAGSPPRDIARFKGLLLPPPAWLAMTKDDRLREIYTNQQTLLRDGQIVWGHVVQANTQLFSPGDTDSPAAIVYSLDPYFDAHPEALEQVAAELYDIKGVETDPDLQAFSDILEDELIRAMHLPIPPRLTDGRQVVYTSIMVRRKDLPTGQLSASFFPLLVVPVHAQATLIVPWEWWSPALVALWRE